MEPGTNDIIILILIFIGLQTWWLIPIIKKNYTQHEKRKDMSEEIKRLESLLKK